MKKKKGLAESTFLYLASTPCWLPASCCTTAFSLARLRRLVAVYMTTHTLRRIRWSPVWVTLVGWTHWCSWMYCRTTSTVGNHRRNSPIGRRICRWWNRRWSGLVRSLVKIVARGEFQNGGFTIFFFFFCTALNKRQ